MITRDDLSKYSDGQILDTVALIKSYEVRTAKNNKKYIDGILEIKGSVSFKVWEGKVFDELNSFDYQDTKCQISCKVNEFNGSKSLILTDVKALAVQGVYDMEDFFEFKYDTTAYLDALKSTVDKNCTKEAQELFTEVINPVLPRFKVEFAARSHHDATMGGLLAHTYKVTNLMSRVIKFYPHLLKVADKDLLIVGSALHDIGKIYEYTKGSIVGNGLLVSHHTFGVEILVPYKERIVELKGEDFYYRLLSIIEQHHGAFEETPRTVEAYVVHLVDALEARMQSIDESLENGEVVVNVESFKLR